jgi:hypothetical protein
MYIVLAAGDIRTEGASQTCYLAQNKSPHLFFLDPSRALSVDVNWLTFWYSFARTLETAEKHTQVKKRQKPLETQRRAGPRTCDLSGRRTRRPDELGDTRPPGARAHRVS